MSYLYLSVTACVSRKIFSPGKYVQVDSAALLTPCKKLCHKGRVQQVVASVLLPYTVQTLPLDVAMDSGLQ